MPLRNVVHAALVFVVVASVIPAALSQQTGVKPAWSSTAVAVNDNVTFFATWSHVYAVTTSTLSTERRPIPT